MRTEGERGRCCPSLYQKEKGRVGSFGFENVRFCASRCHSPLAVTPLEPRMWGIKWRYTGKGLKCPARSLDSFLAALLIYKYLTRCSGEVKLLGTATYICRQDIYFPSYYGYVFFSRLVRWIQDSSFLLGELSSVLPWSFMSCVPLFFFSLCQGYKCLHDDFLRKEEEAHSKFWIKTISPDLSKLLYSILENWRDTWLEIKIHLVMINWVCILEKKVFLLFLLNYIVH